MKVRKRGMFNQLFIWLAILLLAGNTTDTIHIQMVEIGNQSKEISKNIADINASVENITSTVTLTAESANGLALSTHKIAESFEDLSTASQKNSLQSENLREQINKYTF